LQVLKQPRLLLMYAMTAVGYGGSFIAFTFLAPILQDLSGFSASTASCGEGACRNAAPPRLSA
jgi:predicted MFS family arabinose efflux permease